eukprot:CAMPEP_0172670120 /NCGR_PEP_ID=MMETSP1074-20121228/10109_1 /TAXON_ID=2916 /ORGANISM="Ceratium fusus, Strain PA161109" /LENGTH=115 /DNA_ID=CAMNT_0013486989 /DNA_START=93 /DNA_END=437 /DNA_ORIENTATION=+
MIVTLGSLMPLILASRTEMKVDTNGTSATTWGRCCCAKEDPSFCRFQVIIKEDGEYGDTMWKCRKLNGNSFKHQSDHSKCGCPTDALENDWYGEYGGQMYTFYKSNCQYDKTNGW